ncbi:MAG: hypothetical protein HWN66_08180 [Candidatus Helarchaeota archaeon]|nr:hypothetical protein [Candidatus Helarchaeota archaeon]
MPVLICKNCGNLTESEKVDELFCSTCGASLDGIKPEEKEEKPQTIQLPTSQPESDQKPSETPTTDQKPAEQPTSDQKSPEQPSVSPVELPEIKENETESAPPQAQVAFAVEPQVMEVYENKNLVACPQCSYGCDTAWDKCPICGSQISGASNLQKITETDFKFSEETLKEKLVPCPKCNYFCDPNWQKCPICQTELKQSE